MRSRTHNHETICSCCYAYSGIVNEALPWDGPPQELARRAEQAARTRFNSVLLNLHRDERDGVSWHSDDEPELGSEPVISTPSAPPRVAIRASRAGCFSPTCATGHAWRMWRDQNQTARIARQFEEPRVRT
jgi:hypothetical protein